MRSAADPLAPRYRRLAASPIARVAGLLSHFGLALCLWLAAPVPAQAQTPISLYRSFAGNLDYTATGGTLRAAPNSGAGANACAVNASSTASLTLPAGVTVTAAYLYWAGSGSTVDAQVSLNATTIAASRTFTENYAGTYDFFSGFADVTGQVAAGGTGSVPYTFTGLSVDTGAPYCAPQAVLSGWSMVVIYERAAEPLRVINVFDGFRWFRGSSITLVPNNFQIPSSGIDGQHGILTWEGDFENSAPLGGFSESLVFNGTALTDGANPPGNQFNSTINLLGNNASYGVDLDVYDVSALLGAGDTSAVSTYSSGGDLVLLSVEVLSVTNTPVAELAITKSSAGDLVIGQTNSYALDVSNNGPSANAGAVTVTDTLAAGLTFISGAGAGWSCGAAGQDVTCTHPGPLAAGAALPTLSLNVGVDASAGASVSNTATVTGSEFDNILANNADTAAANVIAPDLSASIKTVVDLNGGDADPGDTLRYTVTLTESAGGAAASVRVTDDLPAPVTGFTVVSVPPGASDNSTGAGTGANATGFLDVDAIAVPANGSVDIVFDVTVAAAPPGTVIANTAAVTNPNGPGATPAAADVIVSASVAPASGNKPLYLYSDPALDLSRTLPATPQPFVRLRRNNGPSATWTLTPVTQMALTIDAAGGSVPVVLWLRRNNTNPGAVSREVTLSLASTGASTGPIGSAVAQTVAVTGTPQPFTFNLPLAADTVLNAGSAIQLTVTNTTPGGGNREFRVFPVDPNGGGNSQVVLPSLTVINVDSTRVYDAAFPGGAPVVSATPGTALFVRSVVSDPFGSFDIASALLTLSDGAGSPVLNNVAMALVADSGTATRTYEYAYTLPAAAVSGIWTAQVTANEGTEGTVSHQGSGTVSVGQPNLLVLKTAQTVSDPFNGGADPKAIPGAEVDYTLAGSNQGFGPAGNVALTDTVPANTALFVGNLSAGAPVEFLPQSSGLTFTFGGLGDAGDDVDFADAGGFGYVPVPDADGYDPAVEQVRVSPGGQFDGGASPRTFELRFRLRVQ